MNKESKSTSVRRSASADNSSTAAKSIKKNIYVTTVTEKFFNLKDICTINHQNDANKTMDQQDAVV